MHFYSKEMIVMIRTNYQINGTNPATFMTVSGTIFFQKNLSVENYSLRSATIVDDVLRMTFMPCNLPDALMHGEHFIEMSPQKDTYVVIKTVLDQGDRKHAFYRIVDSVELEGKLFFRVRKYTMHTDGKYENYGIKYRAGENCIPEEGFKLVNTQCSNCHDGINVYRQASDDM